MRNLSRCIAVTVITILFLQCGQNSVDSSNQPPRALSSGETQLVDSGNKFGFKLFKGIVQDQPDSNIFISPLSVSMALGMTYNGANGSTREADGFDAGIQQPGHSAGERILPEPD